MMLQRHALLSFKAWYSSKVINILRKLTPEFILSWYHYVLAFFGAFLYGFPSKKLIVIGVTGTNGKSTTVEMISKILQESGKKTASISSIQFQIGDEIERNKLKMTMPGRFGVQKFLQQAVRAGCTHAVLEVTSEGILQHRHRFINFQTAVFTNLSPEHIERHGSFDKYRETKGKFFKSVSKTHIINKDDKYSEYFSSFKAEHKHTFALDSKADIKAENIIETKEGFSFSVKEVSFSLNLQGKFNILNALAATAVGMSQGISLEVSKKALEKITVVPGRMEIMSTSPFKVVVDYAFTPAALEKVYQTLKPKNGKLICVLGGAGGGRDSWKRPVLGKLADTYCDTVIVTNEDPYDEDPEKIIDEVIQGKAEKILDRRKAIQTALSLAKSGDVVVVTGKGSEDTIAVAGGKKIPWDDREVIKEELDKLV